MTRIDVLLGDLKEKPRNLRYQGYVRIIETFGGKISSSGGSHRAAKFPSGQRITFVEPHGGSRYMKPLDIKKLLMALYEMGVIEL